MNVLDIVILVAVLFGIANGYQRGLWLSLAQYAGLVLGVVAGAAAAPWVTHALGLSDTRLVRTAAVLVLVVGGSIGSSAGYALAAMLRSRAGAPPTEVEHVAGGMVSLVCVLATAWFLGLTFDRGPNQQVAQLIQTSRVLRALDSVAPRPPAFMARVELTLADAPFPSIFAGLEPTLPGPLPLPGSIDTAGVRAAEASTFRVVGRGCSGVVTGSAWSISADHLVTDAHVVAGTTNTRIDRADGRTLQATVVLFDPDKDIAVLYVPGASFTPLRASSANRGTAAAVVGYPAGGPLDAEPAIVEGQIDARGRDIFGQNIVDRQVYVLGANVRPGNSGGPLVDLNGRVLGVVFAASSTTQGQAYALTNGEIGPDITTGAARGADQRIDTSRYACAV